VQAASTRQTSRLPDAKDSHPYLRLLFPTLPRVAAKTVPPSTLFFLRPGLLLEGDLKTVNYPRHALERSDHSGAISRRSGSGLRSAARQGLFTDEDHLQLPECLLGGGKWTGEAIELNIR
jgi:hypothetical protein